MRLVSACLSVLLLAGCVAPDALPEAAPATAATEAPREAATVETDFPLGYAVGHPGGWAGYFPMSEEVPFREPGAWALNGTASWTAATPAGARLEVVLWDNLDEPAIGVFEGTSPLAFAIEPGFALPLRVTVGPPPGSVTAGEVVTLAFTFEPAP